MTVRRLSTPDPCLWGLAGRYTDGNTMRMFMAVAGLELLPKTWGLINIIGPARGRNICLPSDNLMFHLNGQILFLKVDDKRRKVFQELSDQNRN